MKTGSKSRSLTSLGLIVGAMLAVVAVVAAATVAQTGQTMLVENDDLSNIVAPMEIHVAGVAAGGQSPSSISVTLNATNDIGSNANYANSVASLQSLELTVTYQYQSSGGTTVNGTYSVSPAPSFDMFANQHGSFVAKAGVLPSSVAGRVRVQISGWYTWTLSGTNVDGTSRTVNGAGRLLQFSAVVIVQ